MKKTTVLLIFTALISCLAVTACTSQAMDAATAPAFDTTTNNMVNSAGNALMDNQSGQ